jgi:hypothetical protein
MVPVWLEDIDKLAIELVAEHGYSLEHLSITEALGDYLKDNPELEPDRELIKDYLDYLTDGATIEVTLPGARL